MKSSLCLILLTVGLPASVMAQNQSNVGRIPPSCSLTDLHSDIRKAKAKGAAGMDELKMAVGPSLSIKENPSCFAGLLAADQANTNIQNRFLEFARALEARRTDKQAGSASGTGGTSSLVSKGTAAQALSLATEYGALTESVNKQVVTVQGSLEAPVAALVGQKLFQYCPQGSTESVCLSRGGLRILRRLSYGVSFDTSLNGQNITATPSGQVQGTAQPVTFTANPHQITAVTGRVILWSTRDADSDTFKKTWSDALQPSSSSTAKPDPNLELLKNAGNDLLKSFEALKDPVDMTQTEIKEWSIEAVKALTDAAVSATDDAEIDRVWLAQATQFVAIVKRVYPQISTQAADFLQKSSVYRLAEDRFVEGMANKPVLTFEYNNNRPPAQTPTSNFRLIFDKGLGKKTSMIANGAFTIFDSNQPGNVSGSSRLRDAQLGLQVQRDLGKLTSIGAAAVAFTYYFQHQSSPDVLTITPGTPVPGVTFVGLPSAATQVFSEKGNVHVAQVRLVLGAGQSSVRFPVAVSWSNRTELIDKPAWRAQIGVSYDLDSLFAK
jgi:hypothetical protein